MTRYLYHGLRDERLDAILEEGIDGPSYWGTPLVARDYAGDGGRVFRIPVERFEEGALAYNDLLAASINESGGDEVPTDGTWQASLEDLGSVRYDARLFVTEADLVGLDWEEADTFTLPAGP